jgi:hypothetical protein
MAGFDLAALAVSTLTDLQTMAARRHQVAAEDLICVPRLKSAEAVTPDRDNGGLCAQPESRADTR